MKLSPAFSLLSGIALFASIGATSSVRAEESAEALSAANLASPTDVYCVSNVCQGDYVAIQVGPYAGYRGRVIDTNDRSFTATLLLDIGGYLPIDVRALAVISRGQPERRRQPRPRMCPPGTIFDVFRGCVPMRMPPPGRGRGDDRGRGDEGRGRGDDGRGRGDDGRGRGDDGRGGGRGRGRF